MRNSYGVLVLLALAGGCANQQPAAPPTGARDSFETMRDPPIKAQTFFASGQLAESQGRLPEAVTQYKKALEIQADYPDVIYRLGIVYTQQKDYPTAIEMWQRYITITRGAASAYANLGFCQECAGNPGAAEVAYRQGIAKDAKNETCRINYGLLLARHGKANEALLQFQTVLTPAQAHYDLAAFYESQNRKQDAKAEYRKALELDPSLNDAKAKLASLE